MSALAMFESAGTGYTTTVSTNPTSAGTPSALASTPDDKSASRDGTHVIAVTRKRIDRVLIGMGLVSTVVLLVAASLLTWGSSFSRNYVRDELGSQNITFGNAASLAKEGRQDLLKYADAKLDTGQEAQAYASYIKEVGSVPVRATAALTISLIVSPFIRVERGFPVLVSPRSASSAVCV